MTQWIIEFIQHAGYLGVAVLMLLENVFPPIPSELVLPFAGYVAATGKLHPAGVLGASLLGSVLGALAWYWAGRRLGLEGMKSFAGKHGRILTLEPRDVEHGERWFRRHGPASVAFGRIVPTVRSVISMPAGIAKMPLASFLWWTALGSAVWNVLLLGSGFFLEARYEDIQAAVEWVARGVLAVLVGAYVWRFIQFGKR